MAQPKNKIKVDDIYIYDAFIIGGGVNGCGIARDLSGRGLKVMLAEMNDLASGTSSASTKLFHGGLRYLEYFKFRLVREALVEREVLLKNMPHISKPMRFILPYHKDMRFETSTPTSNLLGIFMPWLKGKRPLWLIRFGLFLYDHLGGREVLPSTSNVNFNTDIESNPLKNKFLKGYEYSDCWVNDSRLVVLNARSAKINGAQICNYTKVIEVTRENSCWKIRTYSSKNNVYNIHYSKTLINAAGPWVADTITNIANFKTNENVRLVKGSHIVIPQKYNHNKAYFFQGKDGRIIFAIPYETNFTLIGTTDLEHNNLSVKPICTNDETEYLIKFANQYFEQPITKNDVVWSYSGLRPLYQDNAKSATAATRDYVLSLDITDNLPLLNIFGGKITTHRRLAEKAFEKLTPYFNNAGSNWTEKAPLPGGDFSVNDVETLIKALITDFAFLDYSWANRLISSYGTDARKILKKSTHKGDLGEDFGATLTEAEVRWLVTNEFAYKADDILWRRTKLGLIMNEDQVSQFETWMLNQVSA